MAGRWLKKGIKKAVKKVRLADRAHRRGIGEETRVLVGRKSVKKKPAKKETRKKYKTKSKKKVTKSKRRGLNIYRKNKAKRSK